MDTQKVEDIKEDIKEAIWKKLASADYHGFFVTAEIATAGEVYPELLNAFILQKLDAIQRKGISGRRFVFKEDNWRIYITFFPKNEVVNERYALKNRAFRDINHR